MINMSLTPYITLQAEITKLEKDVADIEAKWLQAKVDHSSAANKADEAKLKKVVAQHRSKLDLTKSLLDAAKVELQELEVEMRRKEKAEENNIQREIDELSIIEAMKDINANFIINSSSWHCIYSSGSRFQPKAIEIDHNKMIDHVFRISDNFVDAMKLKVIAKKSGRLYSDVERTFHNNKTSTLNQMHELRKFWLRPVFGCEPHLAFEVLTDNIAGQRQEYKDQLEKYIAYSYVKPEDIFTPNIDSSGKGGTGRDTLFRILEIIFTEECCGEAKRETVQGTHNGELKGKIWVKISEQNNRTMNIEELKNLTGGHNFRLREMGKDPVQTPRTFRFFMMSNNYEGTAKLTGGGTGTEDRRWEPMLCSSALLNQIKKLYPDNEVAAQTLDDWQQTIFNNDDEIAKWLGCIIERHGLRDYYEGKVATIPALKALHGHFYAQMVARQKRVFDTFMDAVLDLTENSTVYNLDKMYRIFRLISYGDKVMDKGYFGKQMAQWLTNRTGNEWEIRMANYYKDGLFPVRSNGAIIKPVDIPGNAEDENDIANGGKAVFDIWDFLFPDQRDDKDKELGDKPHPNNIKPEFF